MNPQATDVGRAQLAPLLEVFASVQGEGAYVGEPQVFLRLAGCPLRCRYCDTPGSWALEGEGTRVAAPGGTRREERWSSPFRATCLVAEVEGGSPRTISVTGGEPLLWPEFLLGLARVRGPRRLHLETAGAHPAVLARVLDAFDHVSLDLKLPRDLDAPVALREIADHPAPVADAVPGTHGSAEDAWALARRRSLALLRGRDACAKLVVCGGTPVAEYEALLDEVVEHAPELTVVLQPATPVRDTIAPPFTDVERLAEAGLRRALRVRVLPQVHRQLRIP